VGGWCWSTVSCAPLWGRDQDSTSGTVDEGLQTTVWLAKRRVLLVGLVAALSSLSKLRTGAAKTQSTEQWQLGIEPRLCFSHRAFWIASVLAWLAWPTRSSTPPLNLNFNVVFAALCDLTGGDLHDSGLADWRKSLVDGHVCLCAAVGCRLLAACTYDPNPN